MTADVSSETPIYLRLLIWAAWATNRRHVPDRRDELAGDVRLTEATLQLIAEIRQRRFPAGCEAIEKAVAGLRTGHDEQMLFYLIDQYFLNWRTIESIALAENLSEHHVTEYLHRAMIVVSRRLALLEADDNLNAGRGGR